MQIISLKTEMLLCRLDWVKPHKRQHSDKSRAPGRTAVQPGSRLLDDGVPSGAE